MQKQIRIDGKPYKAVLRGKTYRLYRQLFHKDLLVEQEEARQRLVYLLTQNDENVKLLEEYEAKGELPAEEIKIRTVGQANAEAIGEAFAERLAYTAVKVGTPGLPDFDEFVDNIDDYAGFIESGFSLFYDLVYSAIPVEPALEEDETPEYAKKNDQSPHTLA